MAGRIALLAGSILFSLLVLELGLRLTQGWNGLVHWPNLVAKARTAGWATGAISRAVHDPQLGFVGHPGFRSGDGELSYDSRGLRVTPVPDDVALAEPP